ncbi:LLM class flavin-dependent oxidoreductase [Nocardiopsis aegyptia]|uniref:LLM class flavin-dependent oxidoreductase n=1 Tax=Nocardiopsis aegyptia TaxID=220378 RepID=UPI00367137B4
MTDFSILAPLVPFRTEQLLPYAAMVQWSNAHRLWQGQAMVTDPHQMFTAAAGSGFGVPVGTGVTLMPLRHPFEAALHARTMAVTTGHPVIAGFGPGGAAFQKSVLGSAYASPLTATREYVTIVKGLVDGDVVHHEGEYFFCENGLPPVPGPPVQVGIGVLRPGMARLAGEIADVAITWLTPASYLRDTIVPAVREGAARAGRPMPRVVAMVPVALGAQDRDPLEIALMSNAGHIALPHYIDMLSRSGIHVDREDPLAGARALIKGRAFLYGTREEVAGELDAFREAGADEIVLNMGGVFQRYGTRTALTELESLLEVVAP